MPKSRTRLRHRFTVGRLILKFAAITWFGWPAQAAKTIRQRSATCWGVPWADAQIPYPFAPQVHGGAADSEICSNHLVRLASAGGQDNPAAECHLLGSAVG